jgi:hypothetical protein
MIEDLDQAGEIAAAICAGAVIALRRRAERQATIARAGTTPAEGRPDVLIPTGEAAVALCLAEALNRCAADLETGRLA